MASKEEVSEPLQSKTCVLKVSIHCEGCKKKVSRILKNVGGVYEIKIDSQQNKVTVTGNVEAEALIKKLHKSGKHAELWPIEKKSNSNPNSNPSPNNNEGKNKEKGKDADKEKDVSKSKEPNEPPEKNPEKSAAAAATNSETDTKPAAKPAPATTEKAAAAGGKPPTETDTKSGTEVSETSNKKASASASVSVSKPDLKPENAPNPDTETKLANTATNGGGGGGGGKKKGKKEANSAVGNEGLVLNSGGAPPLHLAAAYLQPEHATSYNTVHPTASYLYYAPTPQSYMYSGHQPPPEHEYYPQYPPHYPNYHYNYYYEPMGPMEPAQASSSHSPGSYDFFSDENANSCSVM